ncbi:serine protease inhibitor 88Ea [Orussus abietinus]|uniref:serine protease inhibitor 88Ea n=1 Tax=Orussus abietinus TaxID=222816 RepID=UPI0006262A8A|nr:serine protease inhibitor 88Ea [Orussus abietinus]XP_012278657.1 serine protease inhibitor 88Ea [Orussus abietinus]XP_023289842.1 serine protease inhibitor 88Ea [Orussus abietinus]
MLFTSWLVAFASFLALTQSQCLTGNDSPSMMNPEAFQLLTHGRFRFAVSALAKMAEIEQNENVFFSPYSLHEALTLAYFGALGKTEKALQQALFIPEHLSKVDVQRFYALENSLKRQPEVNESSTYELTTATRMYVQKTKKLRECMVNLFGEELHMADFKSDPEGVRNGINEWVQNVTKGHIKDLIPDGGITEDSDLVLANAIYFKAPWQSRFDPANSKKDIFYASGSRNIFTTFMKQKAGFRHANSETLRVHILELPYSRENVSMFVMLPPFAHTRATETSGDQNQGVGQVEDGILTIAKHLTQTQQDVENFMELLDDLSSPREVEVAIPRFTVDKEIPVDSLLQGLGAGEVMNPSTSDLRGFLQDGEQSLHLGSAVHRARVEVSEEGTTATAATAIFSFRSSRPIEPVVFKANHPFLYFIYDKGSRNILFSGIFRTPPVAVS